MIGGVQTDVVAPEGGVSAKNKGRVLINLHGGGMMVGARYGGQQESIPIASLGRIKVVTVDYRMMPEYRFPAASEDVAAVYKALLRQYKPDHIGIYGCSAGGDLTAASVAWFQTYGLPSPGAVGLFGAGLADKIGDSIYIAALLMGMNISDPKKLEDTGPYLGESDPNDPLFNPGKSPAILRKFPPTLLISGTRDLALSTVVDGHARLVKFGVDAELHVWEAASHCSFAQPVVDPTVPENREAWDVIVKFFDSRLGKSGKEGSR
jgi:acetyl esterase/lipase